MRTENGEIFNLVCGAYTAVIVEKVLLPLLSQFYVIGGLTIGMSAAILNGLL